MAATAVQIFQGLHGAVRITAQTLVRQIDEVQDILDANPQIASLAGAVDAGTLVGDTLMTREEVLAGLALIANFRAYIATEVIAGITVRQAVYRAG